MADIPGMRPAKPSQLVRAENRISFIYLEHCTLGRDSNAITATDEHGVVHIPAASLGVLLLGPGTRVTHQAMLLLADSGSTAVWVGERGVRYYAHGRPLSNSSRLLEAQAVKVSNQSSRLRVARAMYSLRFPDEDISSFNMQQLRGREGARVRKIYRKCAQESRVEWKNRDYDPDDFTASDAINQALSAAHACLYGIVHAVIVSLGCSPGLGFVHTGHTRSFVYDIADLYKAEITIPVAFSVAARYDLAKNTGEQEKELDNIGSVTRRAVRDAVNDGSILRRCARDIKNLLLPDESDGDEFADVIDLWDEHLGRVSAGINYEETGQWSS